MHRIGVARKDHYVYGAWMTIPDIVQAMSGYERLAIYFLVSVVITSIQINGRCSPRFTVHSRGPSAIEYRVAKYASRIITGDEVFRSRSFDVYICNYENRSQSFEVNQSKFGLQKCSNFFPKYFKFFSEVFQIFFRSISKFF